MRVLALAFMLIFLAGCGGDRDTSDLEAFMAEVRARGQPRIDPLPPVAEISGTAYRASDRRSPFEPSARIGEMRGEEDAALVAPDLHRPRQHLEGYSIDRISMVGTLSRGAARHGLVRDGEGAVHRVEVGDYLGEDHGRIRTIGPLAIDFEEIVPDGAGGWVGRGRTIVLEGQ